LRDLARMADRLDRLESGTGHWLASQDEAALREAATDMALRALRAAADPTNFAILKFLAAHTSSPIAELERAIGLGRLALSERVNDLVQVGLAARNIDTDHVQITAGGTALVRLIGDIGTVTAKSLMSLIREVR
ncbi:MAG: hypothetical protein NZM11_11085, partial [Anaerolineales bacterium]|nr:hypothetical protein [Anaerolineales bacterium]